MNITEALAIVSCDEGLIKPDSYLYKEAESKIDEMASNVIKDHVTRTNIYYRVALRYERSSSMKDSYHEFKNKKMAKQFCFYVSRVPCVAGSNIEGPMYRNQ